MCRWNINAKILTMWKSNEHSKIAGLYELKNTLGKGHFAVVKLAEHVFTGEKVAVKVIDKTKMDQISTDHLYHEVTCMKLVQHPNVVRLYQVIETPSKLYLILELGDGGDMFDYIMRHDKGLHEDKAKEYFSQILSAIAYCHQLHVVHRDLKPENVVFFESQGLVKLTDFGFSNRYRPGEKLSTSCGSLAYSAPEILLGEEYDAPAVDVWSLGVILYMLVCGIAPFNEANDSETLTNIMDCRYKVLDHVSSSCQDLIQKMLIREPSQRITLDEIMAHPWLKGVAKNSSPVLSRTNISADLHRTITNIMMEGNFAGEEEIDQALHEDRYDHITSTYFLLAERELLQQELACQPSQMEQDPPASRPSSSSQPIPIKIRSMSESDASTTTKLPTIYSVSPPCKQANLLPPSLDSARRRTFSSSSEESNSSLHAKNPSFIREHLTITPRHNFSVAHGGIDALIEEEERSKSQTTTDDETEVTEGLVDLNPNALASCLQRTSLQRIKNVDIIRMKKRKSAPVLNEIYEERELEEEDVKKESFYHSNFHPSGRHSISTSSPTSHLHRLHPQKGSMTGQVDAPLSKLPPPIFSSRTGRPHRRKSSHRSSSSDASEDEEGESRRESSTNLSTVANLLMRRRRDSSDDDDRGYGGRDRRGFGPLDGGTVLDDVAEQDANVSQDADAENGCGGASEDRGKSHSAGQCSLNNATERFNLRKINNLEGFGHKIVNEIGFRSHSAESRSSSSRGSSSARSSCSNLSALHRLRPLGNRSARKTAKNSSSTRSDTRLVLRCHVTDLKRRLNNARAVSSSMSLGPLNSGSTPPVDCFTTNNGLKEHCRFHNSLPRRCWGGEAGCKWMKDALSEDISDCMLPSLGVGDGQTMKAISHESLVATKRSNLSLVSSTCSASKYVVDPINESPPSPCLPPLPESAPRESPLGLAEFAFFDSKTASCSVECLKPKNTGVLTRLNNLKQASQCTRGALSSGHISKRTIIRKVKHRDCCVVM